MPTTTRLPTAALQAGCLCGRCLQDGKAGASPVVDGYARIVAGRADVNVQVQFATSCKIQQEVVDGTCYTTTWVGGQVIEILPRGSVSPLP
jgi:hypothetical protein